VLMVWPLLGSLEITREELKTHQIIEPIASAAQVKRRQLGERLALKETGTLRQDESQGRLRPALHDQTYRSGQYTTLSMISYRSGG
jgi:hypothetical protein